MESWMDTLTGASLQFTQDFEQTGKDRKKHYDIFPERAVFQEPNKPERPSVSEPLDDAAFIYFVRTVPLEIGRTYSFDRYFKPDANPVRIKVLRRRPWSAGVRSDRRPTDHRPGHLLREQQGRGLVLRGREPHRVQLKADLPVGSLNLYLTSARQPTLSLPSVIASP
jgi:hypothetical protein